MDIVPVQGGYYADLRDPLPLLDSSVRHIHCEHALEHLEWEEALALLSECHRVLEPLGSLRLVVPDAERYLIAYSANDRVFFGPLQHLGGSVRALVTRMEVINQMFRMGGASPHRYAWDFETLERSLRQVGFVSVERSAHNDVPDPFKIDGTDDWRQHESLYLNAHKG